MTETAYPIKTVNGHDYTPASLLQKSPLDFQHHHGAVAPPAVQDDDGQISCVCGYFDDDGWTVACDSCNKWQHQLCYYPEYEDQSLPEALQHYCIDCRERNDIDIQRARNRQQERREQQRALVNGMKRQPSKNHKKKVKEPGYTNGWPLEKTRHDRNSASPRDQPPPAKRPKTSHRTSDPLSTTTSKGHSRKRTVTNASHRRSQSRSPDSPIDFYSEEFMRCYRNDTWAVTDANLHDSIAIANALSAWLNASEEEFCDMHGQEKGEVLMRWDGEIDEIPGRPQLEIAQAFDDRMRDEDNNTSMWKTVTVKESVAAGAYIGELKGHVGFKEEYQRDLANRWSLLRHPEPFVFFHPRLPIYIDARNEGTELRYVRRSCQPNARLQILVTGGTTYHFCFMATEQIDPGMELAVSWDTTDSLPELMRRGEQSVSQRNMHQLSSWVSTVLANCGPCACQSHEYECLMARFDRRGELGEQDDDSASVKAPKSKKRKPGPHISPLNTNFNSRSGSEARKADLEDEQSDSRSASGSAGRGSASRDITPNTHYSHTGSLSTAPELSERERKKLAKEEEMFRRQEEEKSGRTGKKKRNSAGSALNTPSGTSSKHLGFNGGSRYMDTGTSKQTGLPSAKPGRKPKSSSAQKPPVRTIIKTVKRPTPDYVNSEVQCDMDKEEAEKWALTSPPRRPFLSTTQRLLHRCALNNARLRGPVITFETSKPDKADDQMDVDRPQAREQPPSPREMKASQPVSVAGLADDAEMKDADPDRPTVPSPPPASDDMHEAKDMHLLVSPGVSSSLPKEPSAPPWSSQLAHSAQEPLVPLLHNSMPHDMHLQMPPPPANPFSGTASLSAGSPTPASLSGAMTQSPAAMGGPTWPFSPSVAAAVTPSPAKKKLSLSDYTKRTKAKDKEVETKTERDSSPASVASGPVVPPLQASEAARAAAEGSSAIEEDINMEDAISHGVTMTRT